MRVTVGPADAEGQADRLAAQPGNRESPARRSVHRLARGRLGRRPGRDHAPGRQGTRPVHRGPGPLRIKLDYLFVFAVEPPGRPADWTRIIQQRYGYVDFAQWDDPGGTLEPWVNVSGQAAGALCDARDGYIHPDYPHGPRDSVKPSGTPQDPYSLATAPATDRYSCHAVTRT